jgi:hypothetical protein
MTLDDIEVAIANALKARDLDAVAQLLRTLAMLDEARAQVVHDTLELGVALAKRRVSDQESDA